MKVENTKFVAVNYTLTVDGQVADKNPEGQPLEFVCGAGMLLPKFEGALIGKEPGDKVSFTLEPKDGYGELIAEAIVELPKTIFMIDGKVVEDLLQALSPRPYQDRHLSKAQLPFQYQETRILQNVCRNPEQDK